VRKSIDDSRLTVTYVMPARIRDAPVRRVISTYEAVSISSNATNSVNRSPVRYASDTPAHSMRYIGWNVVLAVARP
jgi:hypothetical protein